MKEFPIRIEQELQKGLRRDARSRRNGFAMTSLVNLKPREFGIVENPVVPSPFSSGFIVTSGTWPNPQIVLGRRLAFVFEDTAISTIDLSDWSTSGLSFIDADDLVSAITITSGGYWHFADMGDAWMAFNGQSVVMRTNIHSIPSSTFPDAHLISNTTTIGTGAFFPEKGTLFLTGFNSGETGKVYNPLQPNDVVWTAVGGEDAFWHAIASEVPSDLVNFLERKTGGYAPTPWVATNSHLKRLGDSMLVYCDRGVARMDHVASPVSSWSIRKLLDGSGPVDRGALGGDERTHVFLDQVGRLWRIKSDFGVELLDYREFLSGMVGNDPVISYDQHFDEFYISTDTEAFILTPQGLGELEQAVTSLERRPSGPADGALVGLGLTISNKNEEAVTDTFDMELRSIKTIRVVEVTTENVRTPEVQIHYRYDSGASFEKTQWIPVNKEGFAFPVTSGLDFRLGIRGSFQTDGRIESITIRWLRTDKRNVRGVDVSSSVARSG